MCGLSQSLRNPTHRLKVGQRCTLAPQPGVSSTSGLANLHSSSKTGLRDHLLQKAFQVATPTWGDVSGPDTLHLLHHCSNPTARWPLVSFTPGLKCSPWSFSTQSHRCSTEQNNKNPCPVRQTLSGCKNETTE